MPYRKTPIVPGETYHVFNRSNAKEPIFLNYYDYQRAIELIKYYRFVKLLLRYSHFNRLMPEQKEKYANTFMKDPSISLKIIAYCLMPNHFHLLLQPLYEKALSNFIRNFQHGYSKYFNTKQQRTGSLFQSMFKAVRIETDEQLTHVSRYIHLNPVTSYLIKEDSIGSYPWSSFKDYIQVDKVSERSLVEPSLVLGQFKSPEEYKKFVLDQIDYQRELDKIKHLILE